jgi:hypothetical protein
VSTPHASTARLDQLRAATLDTGRLLQQTAEAIREPIRDGQGNPLARWVVGRMHSAVSLGLAHPCEHLSPASPQPAIWAAWAPERYACLPCAAAVTMSAVTDRCDHCGMLADPPSLVIVGYGFLLGYASVCAGCFPPAPRPRRVSSKRKARKRRS